MRDMFAARLAIALLLLGSCTVGADPVTTPDPPSKTAEPTPQPVAWADVPAMLRELPSTLGSTSQDGLDPLASRIAAVPGVRSAAVNPGPRPTLTVELAAPIDAAQVVALLGWTDVHVNSGDVHQRSWHLVERTEDIDDPYGRRIAARVPRYGEWELEVAVTGRPAGPLPGISAGAAPAYPLDRYTAEVQRITIRTPP